MRAGHWKALATLLAGVTIAHGSEQARSGPSPPCGSGAATEEIVGRPSDRVSWRAQVLGPTRVYASPTSPGRTRTGSLQRSQASWLLVLAARRENRGCWVELRLPSRPNNAVGWAPASALLLVSTAWRIAVSLRSRTLSLYRAGAPAGRYRVVVGAPATPTPRGLFAVLGVTRAAPDGFTGAWLLALTAHSDALPHFDGGEGRVGIHGRGGLSLRDPLGTARSHGCVRLENSSVTAIVDAIGVRDLPGVPVWIG
jgi:hypothetical protein